MPKSKATESTDAETFWVKVQNHGTIKTNLFSSLLSLAKRKVQRKQ
jgi:hypothetical protein